MTLVTRSSGILCCDLHGAPVIGYTASDYMIASFADSETEAFYHTGRRPKRLPPPLTRPALRKLDMLEAAHNLEDLKTPPGNRLEALRGGWAGYYSIRVNEQWRVVFQWSAPEATEVTLIDYH